MSHTTLAGLAAAALVMGCLVAASPPTPSHVDLMGLADLTWGTGGFGFGAGAQLPGVQVPFGVLRLGPDTTSFLDLPFQHYGGYAYDDSHIAAFSHTHTVGAGVGDLGNFGVMVTANASSCFSRSCYAARFTHTQEVAVPGLYSVALPDVGAVVSATATGTHSGMLHVRQTARPARALLLDVCHSVTGQAATCRFASVQVLCANGTASQCSLARLSASVHFHGSLSGRAISGFLPMWLHARLDAQGAPFALSGWKDGTSVPGVALASQWGVNTTSGSLGASATLLADSGNATWTFRSALSFLSAQHAVETLASDQCPPNQACMPFPAAVAGAQKQWAGHFATVSPAAPPTLQQGAGAPSQATLAILAAAWYRTVQAPSTYTEGGGQFPAFGGGVGTAPSGVGALSDMSLWDTHRTHAPLMSLFHPTVARDAVWSLVTAARMGGSLPVWPLANVYTGCMIGSHGVPLMADAVLKLGCDAWSGTGVSCGDIFAAANASVVDKAQQHGMLQRGFVPASDHIGASRTLALAFDAAATLVLGEAAGVPSGELGVLRKLAQDYANVWSPSHQLMCPRHANGSWACPVDPALPYPIPTGYTEGDALQWTYFVPGDIPGLVQLFADSATPGHAGAAAALAAVFASTPNWVGGTTLPNPYYWGGNEPDLLEPWLFNWMSAPGKAAEFAPLTQFWTRWILSSGQVYSAGPGGIPGNDDYGTMSAWAVWGIAGLYPLTGTSTFTLSTPALPALNFTLPSGGTLAILAHNWTEVSFPQSSVSHPRPPPPTAQLLRCMEAAGEARQPSQAAASCVAEHLAPLAAQARAAARPHRTTPGRWSTQTTDLLRTVPPVTGNVYIARAAWNGEVLTQPFLQHAQISGGGLLELWLTDTPTPDAFPGTGAQPMQ